jgi:outer membrane protein assembly factor BamB
MSASLVRTLLAGISVGMCLANFAMYERAIGAQSSEILPSTPLTFGFFTVRFDANGTFTLKGEGWPTFEGTWTLDSAEIVLSTPGVPKCEAPGRYRIGRDGAAIRFDLVADDCTPRRMIVDRSAWLPAGTSPPVAERRVVRTTAEQPKPLPAPSSPAGSWPSFRGPGATGTNGTHNLPDRWNGTRGENILWRTAIPGLGHSSPIVWGQRVFVTSAVSSRGKATFKPGLYGDGDASDDRSAQRWTLYALDKKSGKILWERVAHDGPPVDARHIKSTYASATPATDGRLVIVWFGSQGVHAYDVNGNFRWRVDLGRMNLGAYDIPTFEWGPASSPILWNGLVILQVDTQADSFVIALNADTGETVWKTNRDELPSWGTPTVAMTRTGPELVTNASKFVRGYDPQTGKELWHLGGSSKITAPTPIFAEDLFVVASGRGPERPIFVIKPGSRGDLTLKNGEASSAQIAWSRTGRGSYMPTPIVHNGILYVLANNGVFDAYDLKTGEEIYRQRLDPIGSGFSASPVIADNKIYLSSEDGEILVVAAGRGFKHLATNSMGDLLMATPALSESVMYVRTASSLFAVGSQ